MRFAPAIALFGTAAVALASGALDYTAAGKRWWSHVEYLASDQLQGRQTGSEGYRKAAEYVAGQFHELGLEPAGSDGWFQPVRFDVRTLADPGSSLALVENGKQLPLTLGADAILTPVRDAPPDIDAAAAFVGYGLQAKEANIDDLAGSDLRGKIAVYISSAPLGITGPVRAHYQATAQRWKALRAAGAAGMIAIPIPASMDIPWDRIALSRFAPHMYLADPAMNEMRGEQFQALWNPARADELFAGTGHSISDLLNAAGGGKPLPHFPLLRRIRAHMVIQKSETESPNVVAKLPGADPALRQEYVVMSAHLDHLGIGRPINGDAIYNGAMDNASGVASLIETARALKQRPAPLKRSVIFLAVCGEEKGELGSLWYAAHPTVSMAGIIADVNVDMFLPLFPLRWLEVQGLNESTLGEAVRAAAAADGVQVQADKQPQRNLFIRSDQYSFVRHGVPALAFKFGYVPGDPEEHVQREWLRGRYHAPSDDVKQPVDTAAAAEFDDIVARLIASVADNPARPQWYATSFFRRFATAR
ncbi:MAG TPA: M28 family peptidase [Bryobacteraceae bacterium]|nr:M28 family peptidase [Bryobacteraceae bacterium]